MRYLALILPLLFLGCGDNEPHHTGIDPEFEPYYEKFLADSSYYGEYSLYGSEIYISFGDTLEKGECLEHTNEVIINKTKWEASSDTERGLIIYHELGHCLLGRGHNLNTIQALRFTVSESIMSPETPSQYIFTMFEETYLKELFTNDPGVWDEHLEGGD